MSKTARWLRWIRHVLSAWSAEGRALKLADLAEPALQAGLEDRRQGCGLGRAPAGVPWTTAMLRGYLRAYAAMAVTRAAFCQSGPGGAVPEFDPRIARRAVEILADRTLRAAARPVVDQPMRRAA